jgi:glycosyltransferase involved in cell wall biosynthesis
MKPPPRVLLLVDWVPKDDSRILESLRKSGLDCDCMGINFHHSRWTPAAKILSFWPRCFWASVRAFRRRRDYDYMIAWQQVIGMFLGLIKFITRSDSPKVFLCNATIVERKQPLLEMLRRLFLSVSLKKVNHISFLSHEYMRLIQKRFQLSDSQLVHLKQPVTFEKNPEYSGFIADSYLYCVGLSYRDFPTLMEAAKKCPRPFVLATTDPFLKGLSIPENVTVYRNTFGKAAEELMKQSAAVIFPLEMTTSPAGETTLVMAMFYGKPVITTRTVTTAEYIDDGQTGYLVPRGDADAIVDAVNRLFSDPDRAEEMGRQARQSAMENHMLDVYTKKLSDVIDRDIKG